MRYFGWPYIKRVLLISLLPTLWGFSPFTPVTNVCPKCPAAKTDEIALTTGQKIRCTVIAQNDDYYVISRHGEYRAVTKTEISAMKWKDSSGPTALGTGDQILTKRGVLLHGAIVEEQRGRYFIIQVGSFKHVVWAAQIASVHKGGKNYPFGN